MSSVLGLYEKALPDVITWPEKFAAVKTAGFDYLELSVDESDARLARLLWSKAQRAELLAASRDNDIYLSAICLSGHRKYPLGSADPATARRSLEIMEGAVELAYDLGIRIIQLAGYDVYYEPSTADTAARFEQNLYKATELAARRGVLLGFETMETDFMNTTEKAMRFVRRVNSPYLQVYPDVGNLTNGTEDVPADLRTGAGHLIAAHLKETVEGVFRNRMYGDGRVDFAALIPLLHDLGVRMFTAEFWYQGEADYRVNLKTAHDFLRPLLKGGTAK